MKILEFLLLLLVLIYFNRLWNAWQVENQQRFDEAGEELLKCSE